jgi:hypothetical protein
MAGEPIELLPLRARPGNIHQSRVTLAGGAQTIELGARYRAVELWLDAASPDVHYRINPDGTETAADTDDPKLEGGDVAEDTFDVGTGVSYVYVYAVGATTINVKAYGRA